ncbi:MAG: HTH DNA binding domain protein [Caudoviricetes sp.]|nr:MAG: HTH DNA binding domain protein [Caudoviricetes sp.]
MADNNDNINDLLSAQSDNSSSFLKKLDYSLKDSEARNELVKNIIKDVPQEQLTKRNLEILSNYIIFATNKEARKKNILTDNRMVTVSRRETSFQGLASSLENGEDGIYNMIANDKNILFIPKIKITEEDLKAIPELRKLKKDIEEVKQQFESARGKRKFLLKQQLIELYQNQYIIKNSYKKPITFCNGIKNFDKISFDEEITLNEKGEPESNGIISLFNYKHVSALLANYSRLKEDSWSKFWTDSYYLMQDLDTLVENALKDKFPLYYSLLIYKIDGKSNLEIKELLNAEYGIKYTPEYISSLWRNKIPKLIVKTAKEEYILWYHTNKEKSKWKKCSRCGQIKLLHNMFFSKNSSSKDKYYSICKECRNKK